MTFSLIPSFQPLVIHACGDLALWTNNIENVLVFLSCPSVHTNGVWIRMAALKLTILRLALAPGISLLTSPSSSTSAIQISLGLIALCEVSRPSKEDLNADATKNVGRDEVLHSVSVSVLVPMCALAGLMVPRQPLVADLSYDERVLVWTLLIESGHIPLRTLLGNCSPDLYRPLRLRLLAWAQQVVFQDLHHIWALLQANKG